METGKQLLALAADRSEIGRQALAHSISEVYLAEDSHLSEREEILIQDIIHQVIHELEMPLRQAISLRLAGNPIVSEDLVLTLANDRIEVAYPILLHSPALKDPALLAIVGELTVRHRMAVAGRKTVSETITDALIAHGEEQVIRKVLENPGSRISPVSMRQVVRESRRVRAYQKPLVHRSDLPPDLALEMFGWISAALRQYILERSDIEPEVLDGALEDAIMEDLRAVAVRERAGMPPPLAAGLSDEGVSDMDLVANALNDANMHHFLGHLRKMAGLDYGLMLRALFEPSGRGTAVLCRANGLGKSLFASIHAYMRRAKGVDEAAIRRELKSVLRLFDRLSAEDAKRTVESWKAHEDFSRSLENLRIA